MSTQPGRQDRRGFLRLAARAGATGGLGALLAACSTAQREISQSLQDVQNSEDFAGLRRAYSLDTGVLYLNHASIGTMPRAVQAAHIRYLSLCERNPWLYMWGGAWEEARKLVREAAAKLLDCSPRELAITHNTTEGFNVLARGLPLKRGDEVLFSSLNHPGASLCWEHYGPARGYTVRRFPLPLAPLATMDEDEIVARHLDAIRDSTRVLVLPHVDNVVGLRHPVARIAGAARKRGVKYVAVDGAQSVGMLPVKLSKLGVDFYATSAHKWLQAPKGTGLLYARREIQGDVEPLCVTWGQAEWKTSARRFEDYGTRNLPELLALGDAIAFHVQLGAQRKERRLQHLRDHLRSRIEMQPGLGLRLHSPAAWNLASAVIALGVQTTRPKDLARRLFADDGVVVRPFRREGLSLLRISPNVFTRTTDLDQLVTLITT